MYKALSKFRVFISSSPSTSRSTNRIHAHKLSTFDPQRYAEHKSNMSAPPKAKPAKSKLKENQNPSIERNFQDLGATKMVKWVVVVALSIAGTMKTIFWTKVLMAKLGWGKGERTEELEVEVGDEEERKDQ
ncbi:67fcacfb-ca97-4c64-a1ca-a8ff03ca7678 [Sclerotinia trifoliorum]|uniref:67fcacfb-ca97-4c64-a1ca-a8ff03ca7678 n=1 Tax=Sclerotinia trifoliorum TaxID=28548 RepID=A0A8H2VXX4_9HELO|nr:67fcacfb-ca97-4c64-a1ca-a8ff03ca7678 [Sclerotinia trifoliorum]